MTPPELPPNYIAADATDALTPTLATLPPGTYQLDPLAYFKLKASLLEIALQEAQLREQATVLAQRKVALFADAGMPQANYRFTDTTFLIETVG